jgi:hypothetical protein
LSGVNGQSLAFGCQANIQGKECHLDRKAVSKRKENGAGHGRTFIIQQRIAPLTLQSLSGIL